MFGHNIRGVTESLSETRDCHIFLWSDAVRFTESQNQVKTGTTTFCIMDADVFIELSKFHIYVPRLPIHLYNTREFLPPFLCYILSSYLSQRSKFFYISNKLHYYCALHTLENKDLNYNKVFET